MRLQFPKWYAGDVDSMQLVSETMALIRGEGQWFSDAMQSSYTKDRVQSDV